MEKAVKLTKTERQLLLYEIFMQAQIISYNYIMDLLPINKRMILRDITDLTDAGLICVEFSRKDRCYKNCGEASFNENITGKRRQHLLRLQRIGTLMHELENEDVEFYMKEEGEEYFTCKDSYYELFPNSNERMRQRDFETLRRIGYPVGYDHETKSFYLCDGILLDEDFGVFRENGALMRYSGMRYSAR